MPHLSRRIAAASAALLTVAISACGSTRAGRPSVAPVDSTAPPTSTVPVATPPTTTSPPATTHASSTPTAPSSPPPSPPATTRAPSVTAAPAGAATLPLAFPTGDATEVITVQASSTASTVATLQAWQRSATGWQRHGVAVTAHVGAAGLTSSPSESLSATPIGSFSLTQAFGALANPGTGLPYFQTDSADWWISEDNAYYNTHRHCSGTPSQCGFDDNPGDPNNPNEHLASELPYYNYAVVIDTPSGQAAYPHGSAFFLHVTDGTPTAGCVAIPQSTLVGLMQWLSPAAHPRILIGV